ncbi:unnamed protein product [Bursaphelenchus xylophilus]|nr:unnamed protein product [Bursaphelenchus xylophilus]CAG9123675.1 unnamed protein product [Bursaphelenchus xylophilus]
MASNTVSVDLKDFLNRITNSPENAPGLLETFLQQSVRPSVPSIVRFITFSIADNDLRYRILTILVREYGEETEIHDGFLSFVESAILEPTDSLIELVTAIIQECGPWLGKAGIKHLKCFFSTTDIAHSAMLVRLLNTCIIWNKEFIPYAKVLPRCKSDNPDLQAALSECQMFCSASVM